MFHCAAMVHCAPMFHCAALFHWATMFLCAAMFHYAAMLHCAAMFFFFFFLIIFSNVGLKERLPPLKSLFTNSVSITIKGSIYSCTSDVVTKLTIQI